MKYPLLILGIVVAMLGMGNNAKAQEDTIAINNCCMQDSTVTNRWFIQATTEYHKPFWSKDFKNFINQHSSNLYDLTGVNTVGWTVGIPIPTTADFKLIAEYTTTVGTTLAIQNEDISVRWGLPTKRGNSIFSFDLGGGLHKYTFEYHEPMTTDDLLTDDLDNILTYAPNAFDITQRLWNLHVGVNYEVLFSKRIMVYIGIKYRLLMDAKTTIEDFHKTIDAFPQITHHNMGIQLGLVYYFDKL